MAETEDFSTLKDRARRKLERDMGPLLMAALNDPRTVEACGGQVISDTTIGSRAAIFRS